MASDPAAVAAPAFEQSLFRRMLSTKGTANNIGVALLAVAFSTRILLDKYERTAVEGKLQSEVDVNVAKLNTIESAIHDFLERRGRKIAAEDADFLRKLVASNRPAQGAVTSPLAAARPPMTTVEPAGDRGKGAAGQPAVGPAPSGKSMF